MRVLYLKSQFCLTLIQQKEGVGVESSFSKNNYFFHGVSSLDRAVLLVYCGNSLVVFDVDCAHADANVCQQGKALVNGGVSFCDWDRDATVRDCTVFQSVAIFIKYRAMLVKWCAIFIGDADDKLLAKAFFALEQYICFPRPVRIV